MLIGCVAWLPVCVLDLGVWLSDWILTWVLDLWGEREVGIGGFGEGGEGSGGEGGGCWEGGDRKEGEETLWGWREGR